MGSDQRVDIVEKRRKTSRVFHTPLTNAHFVPNIYIYTALSTQNDKNTHQNLLEDEAFLWNMGTRTQDPWALRHSHEGVTEI